MVKKSDLEYIFWLGNWSGQSNSFWLKTRQLKCIITKSKFSIISVDNHSDKALNVDIPLIRKSKISPGGKILNQTMGIFTGNRKIKPVSCIFINKYRLCQPSQIRNKTHPEMNLLWVTFFKTEVGC